MTTSRQFHDSEGAFGPWHDHAQPCNRITGQHQLRTDLVACGAKVQVRAWESHDGAYIDHQYRCEAGHSWWIDGIDS